MYPVRDSVLEIDGLKVDTSCAVGFLASHWWEKEDLPLLTYGFQHELCCVLHIGVFTDLEKGQETGKLGCWVIILENGKTQEIPLKLFPVYSSLISPLFSFNFSTIYLFPFCSDQFSCIVMFNSL